MAVSQIPIENLYYLLAYAWDVLPDHDAAKVSTSDHDCTLDLLAIVMGGMVQRLLKRGLSRQYVHQREVAPSVRGRINLTRTLVGDLPRQGLADCSFDEFLTDVPLNQVVRESLQRLASHRDVHPDNREALVGCLRRFVGVSRTPLQASSFGRVQLGRNEAHYRPVLDVCELAFHEQIAHEREGFRSFQRFFRDEKVMSAIFEKAVFNFYQRHAIGVRVAAPHVPWSVLPIAGRADDLQFLPRMRTDITLQTDDSTLIIDTKYYREALAGRFDVLNVRSGHLYQLLSYVSNWATHQAIGHTTSGMLLYPTNGYELDLAFEIQGHEVAIKTVDLAKPWTEIRRQLLNIPYQELVESRTRS